MSRPSYGELVDSDPYAFFEDVRREARVYWDSGMESWLVTGYEDCAFIQRREDLFAGPWSDLGFEDFFGSHGLFLLSGEQHRALYKSILRFFSPKVIKGYRESVIRPLIEQQIDRFAACVSAEVASEFADQIPARVMAAMLGLEWKDEAFADRCTAAIEEFVLHTGTYFLPSRGSETREGALRSMQQLDAFLLPLIRNRGNQPQDSLINQLWKDGTAIFEEWDEDDVLGNCRFLFIAGMHTTTELICNTVHLLLAHRELQVQALAGHKHMLQALIEEALRLSPPIHFRPRIALEDVELGGALIREGDRVCTLTAAANRDPKHYSSPCTVDLERRPITGHLSFNTGPRFCAGAPLARVEAFEAIDALLRRLSDLRLDPDAQPPQLRGFLQRAYRPLHVLFDSTSHKDPG